jgi:hypothetical protein
MSELQSKIYYYLEELQKMTADISPRWESRFLQCIVIAGQRSLAVQCEPTKLAYVQCNEPNY